MLITNKFIKCTVFISDKITYNAEKWAHLLLKCLELADWDILKTVILNRDKKFISEVWTVIFKKKDIKLLYSTVYYSQTDK